VQDGNATAIDEVKIMKRGTVDTSDELPSQFVALGEDFCSLGCSIMYYRTMKSLFGNEAYVVLSQLRDVAFYESIYKSFEDDGIFRTSLLRDNISERARREGRYYVYGRNMEEAYSFSYKYELPYHGEDVEIEFKYKYDGQDFERIIGLIGENGVGKTSLIKKILESLIYNDNRNFTGLRPLFSSVLMISYSPFDHYPLATDDNKFFINYEYSGLMKDKEEMFTTKEQVEILSKNIERIYSRKYNFYKRWEHLVNKVIPIDKFDSIIEIGDPDEISIDKDKLFDLCDKASSGETMFLYSISAIMAKIRNDSLIIMDEPEQHLHPRAVTALMHSVYKILKMYDSYALISTHSPYVIRELVSPNVLIFKRFDDELAVKRIGIESFGEDVSVLSDVVFGNMSEEKRYERFIEDVVERNKYDYDASIAELQTGPNSLGLNAKLLIRSVINRRNETSQS
jgi:predicted ATPase